jgi:hypothetical protein
MEKESAVPGVQLPAAGVPPLGPCSGPASWVVFPAPELPQDVAVPTPIGRKLTNRGRHDTAKADHPEGLGCRTIRPFQ